MEKYSTFKGGPWEAPGQACWLLSSVLRLPLLAWLQRNADRLGIQLSEVDKVGMCYRPPNRNLQKFRSPPLVGYMSFYPESLFSLFLFSLSYPLSSKSKTEAVT
jgi:hypothetical protein